MTVNNVAPQVNAGAGGTINEGSTFAGSGSFTDPGADSWTATVDYGDGSGVQALALSGQTFNLSHVYADNGPYTVTVTVNDGTAVGQDTAAVTVNNVAPQVSAGADATIDEGDTFNQSGSFSDPGADSWTATVDYGDGTPVQALALSGQTFNLSHAYTSAAGSPYTVTVTVTDDDTGAGSDPVIVTVLPVAGGVGTVSGKVQDSATGSNLKGVLVTIDMGQTATTDKRGKYSINNVPEGSRTLTFSMTGYVTEEMNSVTVNAGSTTRNVNTTLDPDGGGGDPGGGGTGTVKGTVWDSSGARVQGASVEADTGQSATTKKRGTYNLQNVPAGTRMLMVSKIGCTTQNVPNVNVIDGVTLTQDVVLTCP